MGIPSYFRHILNRYPGLLAGIKPSYTSDILLVDFNCLIYGCVRGPSMPDYREAEREEWEASLLKEIQAYVVKLWNTAGRPATVVLAVDGVVPMAKIKQQRLRRFKSVWLAEKEREQGVRAPGEQHWDTNSITPGTAFMEKLTVSLSSLCKARGKGWSVSGAEAFGEGEQKAMEWVRSQPPEALRGKRITVYGLDADLILLCLLHAGTVAKETHWTILREAQEFGALGGKSSDEFLGLDVVGLMREMFPKESIRPESLLEYICGMSLLGNDFLPHSVGLNIREGGHDRLRSALHRLPMRLVSPDGTLQKEGLKLLLREFASTEPEDIERAFQRKYTQRQAPPRNEMERAMLPVQNLPLEWAEEGTLWSKPTGRLYEDWKGRYYGERAVAPQDIQMRCDAYFQGLQWVLDYYTGKPISTEWMYAWTYPPLWSDLVKQLEETAPLPGAPQLPSTPLLKPQEQLSMVLPKESWWLLRDTELKGMSSRLPHFWPRRFEFESLGKRWMWECHPRLPILTPARLRTALRR